MNAESKKKKEHYKLICFTEEDFKDIDREHDDPMVIFTLIHNFLVKKILIDQESLIDILYLNVVDTLGIPRSVYRPYSRTLVGFARRQVHVEGIVALQVTFEI